MAKVGLPDDHDINDIDNVSATSLLISLQKAIEAQKIDLKEVDREILGTAGEKKAPSSPEEKK